MILTRKSTYSENLSDQHLALVEQVRQCAETFTFPQNNRCFEIRYSCFKVGDISFYLFLTDGRRIIPSTWNTDLKRFIDVLGRENLSNLGFKHYDSAVRDSNGIEPNPIGTTSVFWYAFEAL